MLDETKNKWKSAVFFQDKISAFRYCRGRKYNSVFLDSDVGFRNNIDLIALKLHSPEQFWQFTKGLVHIEMIYIGV